MDDSQYSHSSVNSIHSADEWESWRTILHKLYIEEERPLVQVQQRMKDEHDFLAEDHQYKLRFKKWGFKKNYTTQEKQAWAQGLQNGTVSQDALAHNKPLKFDRIARHIKTQMRAAPKDTTIHNPSLVVGMSQDQQTAIVTPVYSAFLPALLVEDGFSHGTLSAHSSSSTGVHASFGDPRPWFSIPPDEICLRLLALEVARHDVKYSLRSYFWALTEVKLLNGLQLMVHNHAEDAHRSFDWACEEAAAHIQANPASFMISIVLTLSPVWTLYPMTYHRLYTSFLEMSSSRLGAHHSLTKFLEFAMDLSLVHDKFYSACRYVESILSRTFALEVPDLRSRVFIFSPKRLIQEQSVSDTQRCEAFGHIGSIEDVSQELARDLDTDFDEVVNKLYLGLGSDPWAHFTPGFFSILGACMGGKSIHANILRGKGCTLAQQIGHEDLELPPGGLDLTNERLFPGRTISHELESRKWTVAYNAVPHPNDTHGQRPRRRKARPVPVRSTRYMTYHR